MKTVNGLTKIAGAAAIAALASGTADAKIWDFNYSGGGYFASGQFITGDSGSPYIVTGVSGTADGYAITGLSPYASADQLLYYPASGGAYADTGGISFANANGVDYNISNYPTGASNFVAISTLDPGGFGTNQVAVTMSVTAPEPSTWAMMGLGFAGLAFAGCRTRRTATAIA